MSEEKTFDKYKKRGSDYHYQQIKKTKFYKFNSFVLARFSKHIDITEKYLFNLKVNNRLSAKSGINILDVGCGDGVMIYLMSKRNKMNTKNINYFGVDGSEESLEVARKKNPKVKFVCSDVRRLPFENEKFDVIVSSDVIEHIKTPSKMLNEIRRVSKNNALIVIGTPIRVSENPLDDMHVHEFFPKEFKKLCSKYFHFVELRKSHDLFVKLLFGRYLKFLGKDHLVYRYIINVMAIIGKNLFERETKKANQLFCYMYAICKNKK